MRILRDIKRRLDRRRERIEDERKSRAQAIAALNKLNRLYQKPTYSVDGKPRAFNEGEEAASDNAKNITPDSN